MTQITRIKIKNSCYLCHSRLVKKNLRRLRNFCVKPKLVEKTLAANAESVIGN